MKIILAKSAGFCFGVRRAITMAFEAAEQHPKISSLGPIIHSPQMVRKLEEKGVQVVNEVEQLTEGAVIIRSHGVTADELGRLASRDLQVVDATCPFVKKAQEHARLLSREGYQVVLVGEADHPEVKGIVSYAGNKDVFVVADRAAALELPRRPKIGVIAQTTQSFENLSEVVEVCLEKSQETRVFNTICDATSVRQNEAREIAGQVDLMLVIGGFNSANTTRLTRICMDIQPRTHHLETAGQIRPEWFTEVATVGITAGASTPRWLIDEVISAIGALEK